MWIESKFHDTITTNVKQIPYETDFVIRMFDDEEFAQNIMTVLG